VSETERVAIFYSNFGGYNQIIIDYQIVAQLVLSTDAYILITISYSGSGISVHTVNE